MIITLPMVRIPVLLSLEYATYSYQIVQDWTKFLNTSNSNQAVENIMYLSHLRSEDPREKSLVFIV